MFAAGDEEASAPGRKNSTNEMYRAFRSI